jgi:hypothetical protein
VQTIKRAGIGLVVVAVALLLMLGQFWIIYVAPLALFIGVAVVYGYLSAQPESQEASRRGHTR